MTSKSLEVKESSWKNLFWAVACLISGGLFLYFAVFEGSLGKLGLGIGGFFVLGSILFFWPVFNPKTKILLNEVGIWTHVHKEVIPWEDFKEIAIESNMLIIEVHDVGKHFSESSKFTKALLRRVVIDLGLTDADSLDVSEFILNQVNKHCAVR